MNNVDLSSSWAYIFENELANSLGIDIEAENKIDEVDDSKDIYDIVQTKCETLCDIDILDYELVLIHHIKDTIKMLSI